MAGNARRGYALVATAGILWGSIGLFVSRLGALGMSSSTIAVVRLACGAAALVPVMLVMGKGASLFRVTPRQLIFCALLGIFSQALNNCAYGEAIEATGAATASVLQYTAPVFVCIMARLFFGERITPEMMIAIAVNLLGSVLSATDGNIAALGASGYGIIMGLAAGFFYALLTILGKPISGECSPLTIIFYSFLVGAIVLGAITRPWGEVALALAPEGIPAVLSYAIFPTAGAYVIYMAGLAHPVKASVVPVIASVETVAATAFGVLALGEDFGMWKLAGLMLVIISVALMQVGGRERPAPSAAVEGSC